MASVWSHFPKQIAGFLSFVLTGLSISEKDYSSTNSSPVRRGRAVGRIYPRPWARAGTRADPPGSRRGGDCGGSGGCERAAGCGGPLTAVRLENLWLDGLIAGTAHYEIEVVMCGIMAK